MFVRVSLESGLICHHFNVQAASYLKAGYWQFARYRARAVRSSSLNLFAGVFFLTNYRIIYRDYQSMVLSDRFRQHPRDFSAEIPLGTIIRVEKDPKLESVVHVYSKDFRYDSLAFVGQS